MISAPAVQFKGSGWYVTDYANKSHAPASSEGGQFGIEEGREIETGRFIEKRRFQRKLRQGKRHPKTPHPKTTLRKKTPERQPGTASVRRENRTKRNSRRWHVFLCCVVPTSVPAQSVFNHVEEMLARLASGDAVGFIGIDQSGGIGSPALISALTICTVFWKCTLSSPVPWAIIEPRADSQPYSSRRIRDSRRVIFELAHVPLGIRSCS